MIGVEPKIDVSFLTREDAERIHMATLSVLNNTGVIINDEECLRILDEFGANIEKKKGIVKIPEYLVKEALSWAPSRIECYPRNSHYNLKIEGRRVYFGAGGPNVPGIIDLETGMLRAPHNEDVAKLARLADALENIHFYNAIATTVDVAPKYADIYRWAITFKNFSKTIFDGGSGYIGAKAYIEMAAAIAGSKEELRKKPFIIGFGCPVSPLQHPSEALVWLKIFAKEKLPYCTLSQPIIGASSPATIAGSIVMMNAETLSGVVLSEIFNKGTPVIYGENPFLLDMKLGSACGGTPEVGIAAAVVAEMAQFYRLPSTVVFATDSKLLDAQYGFERSSIIPCAMIGCNLIEAAGMIDSGLTASYEELVLTNEFLDVVYRLIQSIEVSDELIATNVIHKVGPGGHYLAEGHTIKHATTTVWYPKLIDRGSRKTWEKSGAKALDKKARETVKKILEKHEPIPLDKDVEKNINEIVKKAVKELG